MVVHGLIAGMLFFLVGSVYDAATRADRPARGDVCS